MKEHFDRWKLHFDQGPASILINIGWNVQVPALYQALYEGPGHD